MRAIWLGLHGVSAADRGVWPVGLGSFRPARHAAFEWLLPLSESWSGTLIPTPPRVSPARRLGLARKTIVKLDPRQVEAAVRRVAETIDLDGKGKMDTVAKAAVAKIGPERATRIAAAATRALKRLVPRLDPDHVGQMIGDLVAAAKSANDKKGRLRVVGFLASLVGGVGRALKSVAKDVEIRDVAVVVLIILATAPELLVAVGVSAAALRVLTPLIKVLVEVLPDRKDSPA